MTSKRFFGIALTVGAPLALAVLELFHPQPHDLFHLDLRTWMLVHYLQIGLFPLSALAMVLLLRDLSGFAVWLNRIAMFVFAVSYVAFDTAAGVTTGVLLQAAQATGAPENWQAPVMSVWTHPVIGGAPGSSPLLAVVGTIAWSVGSLATAWTVRKKFSLVAAILLVVSGFGLSVFKTHAWPGGPSHLARWLRLQPGYSGSGCRRPIDAFKVVMLWTHDQFSAMCWHDNDVHAFRIIEGPHGTGELILDLDYILEWMKESDAYRFKIVPVTLKFVGVTNLQLILDYATPTAALAPFLIHSIDRRTEQRERYVAEMWKV